MFFTVFKFNNSLLFQITICVSIIFFVTPPITITYFGMFEIKFYSYRIIKDKIELASCKEDLLFGKQLAKGFICIIIPFLVIVFITEPSALLVSLSGMAGVGILAGVTLFSKGYAARHLDYQHLLTHWDKVTKIEIVEPTNIIYIWGTTFYHTKHNTGLFYNKHNKDALIAFIK